MRVRSVVCGGDGERGGRAGEQAAQADCELARLSGVFVSITPGTQNDTQKQKAPEYTQTNTAEDDELT